MAELEAFVDLFAVQAEGFLGGEAISVEQILEESLERVAPRLWS